MLNTVQVFNMTTIHRNDRGKSFPKQITFMRYPVYTSL